jgi:hypothetical protein
MVIRAAVLIVFAILALTVVARAADVWRWGSVNNNHVIGPPPPQLAGNMLLENGTDSLLLEDGTSDLCFEGGC